MRGTLWIAVPQCKCQDDENACDMGKRKIHENRLTRWLCHPKYIRVPTRLSNRVRWEESGYTRRRCAGDVQEDCKKNVSKNEGKTLTILLGAYWCHAAVAKR
jgi:hypothetical protein